MPKLSSGRCVGITQNSLRNMLDDKSEQQVLHIIGTYRLQVRRPADLLHFCQVVSVEEDASGRIPGSERSTGLTVRDVLEGRSGWCDSDVAEFMSWLAGNARVQEWARVEFDAINATIAGHPLWKSDFMLGE